MEVLVCSEPWLHSAEPTDVLVGFAHFDELREAALHDARRPFVHMILAVVVTTNNALDTLKPAQDTVRAQSCGDQLVPFHPKENKWEASLSCTSLSLCFSASYNIFFCCAE